SPHHLKNTKLLGGGIYPVTTFHQNSTFLFLLVLLALPVWKIYYAYNCGNSCIAFCNYLVLVIARNLCLSQLYDLFLILHHLLWLLYLLPYTTDIHSYLWRVHTLLTLSSLCCGRTSFFPCEECVPLLAHHTCHTILVLFASLVPYRFAYCRLVCPSIHLLLSAS